MRGQTNASNIGGNVGSDTKPIKIINGVATAITNDLVDTVTNQTIGGYKTFSNTLTIANFNTLKMITASDNLNNHGEVVCPVLTPFSSDYSQRVGNLFFRQVPNSLQMELWVELRQADGTYSYTKLV